MKAIASDQEVVQKVIKKISSPDNLVCIEGIERFDFVDGSHKNMSEKRCRAVVTEAIEAERERAAKEDGRPYRPMGSKKLSGIVSGIIRSVMTHNVVSAAFDTVPGWPQGIVKFDGENYLIRRAIEPVKPILGDWEDLQRFFESAFGMGRDDEPHGERQLHSFYCLVHAKLIQMLRKSPDRGGGPLLVLVGPRNTGKTFLVRVLVHLLGQREGAIDPSAERNGWTDALLSSPVLFYDEASREETSFGEGQSRSRFAEYFKGMEYSTTATIATRGQKARVFPTVWLWVRALNPDSRAALLQTPVPDENSMDDKLIITRFYRAELPLAGQESMDARAKRWDILQKQIPHFAHWLLHEFPEKVRRKEWIVDKNGVEHRFEVSPFAHPEILELLKSSENDSMKRTIVLGALHQLRDSLPPEFAASDLHSHALIESQRRGDCDGTPPQEVVAFCRTFSSAEKVGRILSMMAKDPEETQISCIKRSNRSYYTVNLRGKNPQNGVVE